MNKIVKKLFILLFCFVLCGCSVKNNSTLTIKQNKEVDYSILIAFDKDLISALSKADIIEGEVSVSDYVNDNIKDDYLNGFVKTDYSDTEYIGNEYNYSFTNIDEITGEEKKTVTLNNNSIIDEILFTKNNNIYSANFNYNLKDKYNYANVDFQNVFTVNLPYKVITSNADKVLNDGKTLMWNIKNGENKNIKFSFSFTDYRKHIVVYSLIFDALIFVGYIICKKVIFK